MHIFVLLGKLVGHITSAIRRIIIHHQHIHRQFTQCLYNAGQVVLFIVGRHNDECVVVAVRHVAEDSPLLAAGASLIW